MKINLLHASFLHVFLIVCLLGHAQSGSWKILKTKNDVPGRDECSLATVGNTLFLIGGQGPAMRVEVLDLTTLKWSAKAVAPVPFNHFQSVALGNKIYVLDAFNDGSYPNQVPASNAYCYDTEKDNWQKLAGLSEDRRRGGAGAATYNGKLYLVCGIKHGHVSGTCNLFDVYDPATNKWTAMPDAPHIRDHSMAVVIDDKLLAIGGRNTSLHDPGNFMSFFSKTVLEVDCFDFKTGKWTTLAAKLPLGTGGGTAVNLSGKLFYIGGERATDTKPNCPQKDVYYLDINKPDHWVKAADLNAVRNGVGGTVYDHKIYIAGGSGGGTPPKGPPPGAGPGGPPIGGMPGDPPPAREPANGKPQTLPFGAKPERPENNLIVEEFTLNDQ